MYALIIYESMYGNTHVIAERIADGLREGGVTPHVVSVEHAAPEVVARAGLVVIGGPTHAHGMTWERTREAAVDAAAKDPDLHLEPDAEGPGLREWFASLSEVHVPAAAFDTRMEGPMALTGHASKGISKRLHHHGFTELVEPMSFVVDKHNHLLTGEEDRAVAWGRRLASMTAPLADPADYPMASAVAHHR